MKIPIFYKKTTGFNNKYDEKFSIIVAFVITFQYNVETCTEIISIKIGENDEN